MSTLAGTGDATLKNLDAAMREARPAIRDSQQALEELSGMSRAVRRLADLLERQPESVILGKERE